MCAWCSCNGERSILMHRHPREMTGHKADDRLPGRHDAVVGEELREDRVPHTEEDRRVTELKYVQ